MGGTRNKFPFQTCSFIINNGYDVKLWCLSLSKKQLFQLLCGQLLSIIFRKHLKRVKGKTSLLSQD